MPRSKVKFAFIENPNERKAAYEKTEKGFLKKAHELSTLFDVEMAAVIYSPYRNETVVFPNNDAAMNTFTKFIELPEMETSKHMIAEKDKEIADLKQIHETVLDELKTKLEESNAQLARKDEEILRERQFANLLSARLQEIETKASAIFTPAPVPASQPDAPTSSTGQIGHAA